MLILAVLLLFPILRIKGAVRILIYVLITCMPMYMSATSHRPFVIIPAEMRSNHFIVSVNGKTTPVVHAASNYYLLNFDITGPAKISVSSDNPHFWDAGVEVQPMRFGIRPERNTGTITFSIPGPMKLSISRPGDHFAESEMLFLFANPPDLSGINAKTSGVRYFAAGVHRENIDAHSGETIFIAPGAVVLGALNLWQVHDVRVLGSGMIVYDGPQISDSDEGWMHKKNWHCIVMDSAVNIEIDDITCITRSRTWQVQMKDSRHIGFYNIKVIGGNPSNANQDGLDWLGGGDTAVRNSFFRASDDVFAIQGNWEGYELAKLSTPGNDVTNITIEDTIASTSISNTLRVGWPQKTFNSAHVHMNNVDVIHTGAGSCKVPFAFFELWADPDGRGSHEDYGFHNIWLEDWYSTFQIRQAASQVRDVIFDGVWAMNGPAMLPPTLSGNVSAVILRDTSAQAIQGAETTVHEGASAPMIDHSKVDASFTYSAGLLQKGQRITFTAHAPEMDGRRFEWILGDGRRASGHTVDHRFSDNLGTLLDGSGRFRILLHVADQDGKQFWSSQSLVLTHTSPPTKQSEFLTMDPKAMTSFQYPFHVAKDGGYTFTLLTSTTARISIDGSKVSRTIKLQPQVCGSTGYAVQAVSISVAIKNGEHLLKVERGPEPENAVSSDGFPSDLPVLLWEGPNLVRQSLFEHDDRLQ